MRRMLPTFGAALLALSAAQAQPEADLTLPFTLEAGLPVLQARIDGRDARLLIDSGGAAALALRPDWAPAAEAAGTVSTQDAQGQVRPAAPLVVGEVVLAGHGLPVAPPAQTWSKAKRPADWTPQKKLAAVMEAARLAVPSLVHGFAGRA